MRRKRRPKSGWKGSVTSTSAGFSNSFLLHRVSNRWIVRLTESAGLEPYMSKAALAPTGGETASPNSGENRWAGFDVHDGPENAVKLRIEVRMRLRDCRMTTRFRLL